MLVLRQRYTRRQWLALLFICLFCACFAVSRDAPQAWSLSKTKILSHVGRGEVMSSGLGWVFLSARGHSFLA